LHFFLGCTDFTTSSYIRLKPESDNKVRVYIGHREARTILADEDFERIVKPEMQKQGYCPEGYKFIPGSVYGSGQGLQSTYLVECAKQ
jgi:hypothetical protein